MPVYNAAYTAQPPGAPPHPHQPFPAALQAAGPVVPVQIEVPAALAAQLQQAGTPIPTPVTGLALIDTGASISAVDAGVIQQLGVHQVGVAQIGGVGGVNPHSLFPCRFVFPGVGFPSIDFTSIVGAPLVGIGGVQPQGQQTIALFGRDLLQLFILVYNGPGATVSLAM